MGWTTHSHVLIRTNLDANEVRICMFLLFLFIQPRFLGLCQACPKYAKCSFAFLFIQGLSHFDFDIKYSNNTVTWEDQEVNMKPQHFFRNPVNTASCLIDFMEIDNEQNESFLKEILPSKYGKVETDQVAEQQEHLKPEQRTDLKQILGKYTTLFNGELGKYTNKKVHLQLHDEVQPFHGKAYPVPFIHKKVFYDELQCLVAVNVLE